MGELSDLVLDGDLCEGCGEYMGSPGAGFRRLCAGCQGEPEPGGKLAPCEFCRYVFDVALLGRYGCPNCEGEPLDPPLRRSHHRAGR